jgi:hypothetical protein
MDRLKGRKFGILADLGDQFVPGCFNSTREAAPASEFPGLSGSRPGSGPETRQMEQSGLL